MTKTEAQKKAIARYVAKGGDATRGRTLLSRTCALYSNLMSENPWGAITALSHSLVHWGFASKKNAPLLTAALI